MKCCLVYRYLRAKILEPPINQVCINASEIAEPFNCLSLSVHDIVSIQLSMKYHNIMLTNVDIKDSKFEARACSQKIWQEGVASSTSPSISPSLHSSGLSLPSLPFLPLLSSRTQSFKHRQEGIAVGDGSRSGPVDVNDRCVIGRPHKMQSGTRTKRDKHNTLKLTCDDFIWLNWNVVIIDLIDTYQHNAVLLYSVSYTAVFLVWHCNVWSKCCNFCRSTGTGRTIGRFNRLPVGSGQENLDRLHLRAKHFCAIHRVKWRHISVVEYDRHFVGQHRRTVRS